MFNSLNALRFVAVCGLLAFAASDAQAAKQGKKKNQGNHTSQSGPLDNAIKALQAAEKDLGEKKGTDAREATHAAENIVRDQAKAAHQPEKQGGDKTRAAALDAVLKDIKDAEGKISARKPDEATTALKSAIDGLEGLTGAKKEAPKEAPKKKKN
jgi:hypothetical protein